MTEPAAVPLAELVSLDGRVAVVTGGAAGLGAAIARRLAEAGAAVVVADLDEPGAVAAAAALDEAFGAGDGRRARGVAVDVARSGSLRDAADMALAEFGRLDIWVNNAGIFPTTGPLAEVTDDFVDRMLAVNVRGTIAGCREAARCMDSPGVIVNISSTTGHRGSAGVGVYSASKHAVEGITKTLALELADREIRVLAVAPWMIETPGVRFHMGGLADVGIDVGAMLADNPLGRVGDPDDVARVVLFAVSDLASWMTGTSLVVDAGRTAR